MLFNRAIFKLRFLEGLEADGECLTERVQAAVDAHPVQLLAAATVELQDLEARRDVPDVDEGDVGELDAPLHGDADPAAERHDVVAQALAEVEASVRVGPHTVSRVSVIRLGEDVLEAHLE